MSGAIPPLPNTPSWRVQLKSTGTTLPLLCVKRQERVDCGINNFNKIDVQLSVKGKR
jgi:hypothetical protein